MKYTILYDEKVVKIDIPKIDKKDALDIKRAIDQKLTAHPELFGKPLRTSLVGFRKLRVGMHRIIFEISQKNVTIFAIGHRKNAYDITNKRAE